MFDTIKLHLNLCLTEEEINNITWNKTSSKEDHDIHSGRSIFKTYYKGESEPRILYRYNSSDNKSSLKVEVSIPKFLYGNNVMEVKQDDIPAFLNKLRCYVAEALDVPIARIPDLALTEVEKLHVCTNFQVGNKKKEYLKALSNVQRRSYELYTYRNSTTVSWHATTRREKIYDKEEELLHAQRKKRIPVDQEVLELAKGILRYEIELSDKDMRQHSPMRLAGELLDFQFALKHLSKGLNDLGVSNMSIPYYQEIITNIRADEELKIQTRTNLIAFVYQHTVLSDNHCREYYSPSVYYRLKTLLDKRYGFKNLMIDDKAQLTGLILDEDRYKGSQFTLYYNSWHNKKIKSIGIGKTGNDTSHHQILKWSESYGINLPTSSLNKKRFNKYTKKVYNQELNLDDFVKTIVV